MVNRKGQKNENFELLIKVIYACGKHTRKNDQNVDNYTNCQYLPIII